MLKRSIFVFVIVTLFSCSKELPVNLAADEPFKNKKNKILVVLSGVDFLALKDGSNHKTGYYLSELYIPLRMMLDSGYEVDFANPTGKTPSVDLGSVNDRYFESQAQKKEALHYTTTTKEFLSPIPLSEISDEDLSQYMGIFLPGGHAPLQDLLVDPDLGRILRHFHENKKPTALICHAPVALISTIDDPSTKDRNEAKEYVDTLIALQHQPSDELEKKIQSLTEDWIYKDTQMTVFSTQEEMWAEQTPKDQGGLGARVPVYPEVLLSKAGANVITGDAFKSHAVSGSFSELVTGQNPKSDHRFAELFLELLTKEKTKSLSLVSFDIRQDSFESNVLYDASIENLDWRSHHTTLYIGQKKSRLTTGNFFKKMKSHIELVQTQFKPYGLLGYIVHVTDTHEIAYMAWSSEEAKEKAFASQDALLVLNDADELLESRLFMSVTKKPEWLTKRAFFRLWRGWKIEDMSYSKFLEGLNNIFVPETRNLGFNQGLLNYIPAVLALPEDRKDDLRSVLPDEIALLFYDSEEKYRTLRNTPRGKAYGALHWDYFSKEKDSKSSVPTPFLGQVEFGNSYDVLLSRQNWNSGQALLNIYESKTTKQSALEIEQIKGLAKTEGLISYVVLPDEKYTIEFTLWNNGVSSKMALSLLDNIRGKATIMSTEINATLVENSSLEYPGALSAIF